MTEFDDMTKRILDKLDDMSEAIDSLCGRIMKVEIELSTHFAEIERKNTSKDRKFYVIIGIMAIGFTGFEILQGLL